MTLDQMHDSALRKPVHRIGKMSHARLRDDMTPFWHLRIPEMKSKPIQMFEQQR